MNTFIDEVICSFYKEIHVIQSNNWDFDRFHYLGPDADSLLYIDQYSYYLKFFLEHHDKFSQVYDLLADVDSRKWLSDILLFRLLGHLHFRLPTNSEYHWQQRKIVKDMPFEPSELDYSGILGSLQKYKIFFEGHNIFVDCWWANIAWTFLFRQYYFQRDFIKIQPELGDYIIDAGGCFGDTAIAFAATVGENGKIFSFEVDPGNIDVFCVNLMQNEAIAERIVLSDYALSDTTESQLYLNGSGPGARINHEPSDTPITTMTIDQLVDEGSIEKVDFMKMDIEGSELNALYGAVETIRKFRPKLAISVYHKPGDILEIPIFLNSLDLGYKFYLEHYTIHNEETILYAAL